MRTPLFVTLATNGARCDCAKRIIELARDVQMAAKIGPARFFIGSTKTITFASASARISSLFRLSLPSAVRTNHPRLPASANQTTSAVPAPNLSRTVITSNPAARSACGAVTVPRFSSTRKVRRPFAGGFLRAPPPRSGLGCIRSRRPDQQCRRPRCGARRRSRYGRLCLRSRADRTAPAGRGR